MPHSFTKTTRTSYGGRIKNSIVGFIIGILLFLASFVVLWKNEANGARLANQEKYVEKNAIEVSVETPQRENDNKIIVTSGKLLTQESLSDENLMVRNALVLNREVEMYQWVEHKHTETRDKLGGGEERITTYEYKTEWRSKHIDSSHFEHPQGHQNPDFPIASIRLNAPVSQFGGFIGGELQSSQIKSLQPITNLPQSNIYEFIDGKYYSKGASVSAPKVGDIRISYSYAPSGVTISLIGNQNPNNTISAHPTKYGKIYWQEDDLADKATMLKNFKAHNSMRTNLVRLVGWLLMFFGLLLISGPLSAIAKFIPFLGNVTGFLGAIVALLNSLVLSIITIAIAWFAYRPFSAILLLLVAGLIIYGINNMISKNKQNIPQEIQ